MEKKRKNGRFYDQGSDYTMIIFRKQRQLRHYFGQMGINVYQVNSFDDLKILSEVIAFLKDRSQTIGICGQGKEGTIALWACARFEALSLALVTSASDRLYEDQVLYDQGQRLPYQLLRLDEKNLSYFKRHYSRDYHEPRMIEIYEYALRQADDSSCIPLEQAKAALYVFDAVDDAYWNSKEAMRRLKKRLEAHGYRYPFKHTFYKYGTHDLLELEHHLKYASNRHHYHEVLRSRRDVKKMMGLAVRQWMGEG